MKCDVRQNRKKFVFLDSAHEQENHEGNVLRNVNSAFFSSKTPGACGTS